MINKVILLGNVGADPEVHTFESGNKVVRLRIATSERIFNPSNNTWADHTEWHTVVVGQRHASFVEMYVKKGAQVYVEGKLRRREWGDGNEKRYFVEIRADEFRLLGRRSDNQASSMGTPTSASNSNSNYGATPSATQSSSSYGGQTSSYNSYGAPQEPQAAQQSQNSGGYGASSSDNSNSYQQPSSSFDEQTDDIPF